MLASYKGLVRSRDIAPIAETETEKNREIYMLTSGLIPKLGSPWAFARTKRA